MASVLPQEALDQASYLKIVLNTDSPVSGGTVAAKNGNLAIMVEVKRKRYFIRPRRFFIRWVDQF